MKRKPNLAGVFDPKPKPAPDFLAPITIHASDPPAPDDDGPATVAIEPGGATITMTRAQRRALIEQVHEVRQARAAANPFPDEGLLAVFRPGPLPEDDYVPRVLNPPPPEEDEASYRCNLPAPSPTPGPAPRRRPGRPPKYGPKAEAPSPEPETTLGELMEAEGSRPPGYTVEPLAITPADPEIAAIASIHATLSGLDPAARRRVLAYCSSRFPIED